MQIFDKVCEIISTQLGIDPDFAFSEKTTWEEINADSIDRVEVVMALEDEFDLEIPDEELAHMHNLGDLVNYIDSEK